MICSQKLYSCLKVLFKKKKNIHSSFCQFQCQLYYIDGNYLLICKHVHTISHFTI